MRFLVSRHAEEEMVRRQIPREWLESVLENPRQRLSQSGGKEILQSRMESMELEDIFVLGQMRAFRYEAPGRGAEGLRRLGLRDDLREAELSTQGVSATIKVTRETAKTAKRRTSYRPCSGLVMSAAKWQLSRNPPGLRSAPSKLAGKQRD